MSLLDSMFKDAKRAESSVEFVYDNQLSAESSDKEILDWMLSSLCSLLDTAKVVFKGGYALSKMLPEDISRATTDIDFSIMEKNYYDVVISSMRKMGEELISMGVIDSYVVKEGIEETKSGGIKLCRESKDVKDLGIDVGLHDITYGTTKVKLGEHLVSIFMIERMLSDKISAIYSRKRFRRPKDLYDFYVITNYFDVSLSKLSTFIDIRGTVEWDKTPFVEAVMVEYKKAYDKLNINSYVDNGYRERPKFEEVMNRLNAFVISINEPLLWKHAERRFVNEV